MSGFWLEYGTLLLRWLHLIAAIAWIGESFYFVALDRGLKAPKVAVPGLAGESWSVHGGGFYLKQKFLPAPAELPPVLHWSKWKAYTTWLSGMALFALTYLLAPTVWLVDPRVVAWTPAQAVALALAFPLVGWLLYDALCRAFGKRERLLGGVLALVVLGLCVAATEAFAGRAAFLIVGATLGTLMAANVYFVIIPGQKRMVAALARGAAPNPNDGARGRQRSVHNTYLTLPVVFAMLSVHYAPAWAHPHNGLVLALFLAAGALIRQFFVLWHSGGRAWGLLGAGALLLVVAGAWLAPRPTSPERATASANPAATAPRLPDRPTTADLLPILARHCGDCHALQPKFLPSAPKGMLFDSAEQVESHATLIHQQTVVLRIMPPGNLTRMDEEERAAIARWFAARGPLVR